jgi:hypothetical protein
MAAIFAYFSSLNNGELDESYHIWFFIAAVVGSVLVAGGILLESHWPISRMKVRERWGITLVILGVVIEASFTFALLTFDEGVSRKQQETISTQQSTIIDLESKLQVAMMRATSRRLMPGSAEQRELTSVMSKFAGMPVNIMAYEDDHEDRTFAIELMRALHLAGLNTPSKFERVDAEQIGFSDTGMMISSGGDERSKEAALALAVELNNKLYFCVGFPPPQVPDNIRNPGEGSILVFVRYKGSQSKCK